MRLRVQIPDAHWAEGFHPGNDPFGREELAKRLTSLFTRLEHGTVSLLDGRWGSGKTAFAKTWYGQLRKEGIPAIYFDAFSSDYLREGFTAISAALISAVKQAKKDKTAKFKALLDSATAIGKRLAVAGTKAGVKAATFGALGKDEFEALGGAIEDVTDLMGDYLQGQVRDALLDHDNAEKSFNAMRKCIADLPELLSKDPTDPKPLIIIIDELDRCRPNFALDILESLKHFFQADRVHFLLITNKDHLLRSVDKRYGSGDYSSEYLQKFYDFTIDFGHPSGSSSPRWRDAFIKSRFSDLLPSGSRTRFSEDLADLIGSMSVAYDLSLREIESCIVLCVMVILSTDDNELRPYPLIAILILMKVRFPERFNEIKQGKLSWQGMQKMLALGDWRHEDSYERLVKLFQYYMDEGINRNDEEWEGFGSMMWRYNIRPERLFPLLAANTVERFSRI